MEKVVPIINDKDMKKYVQICKLAYPTFSLTVEELFERFQRTNNEDKNSYYYVHKDGEKVKGGMRLINYEMNYRGQFIDVGGVGMVAVDLLAKKQGIARSMMTFFLNRCHDKGQMWAILYPFRPDFYYKMGFGYGPLSRRYSFSPASLPYTKKRDGWCYLNGDDLPLIADCYRRYAEKQHGYCLRSRYELNTLKRRIEKDGVVVGYMKQGYLDGYIYFERKAIDPANFLRHALFIKEWINDTPEAFQVLSNFLHVQADQYEVVEFETQQEGFEFVLHDIRHSERYLSPRISHENHRSGYGLMYRLVDLPAWFNYLARESSFAVDDLAMALQVTDSFIPTNQQVYHLELKNGLLSVGKVSDKAITVAIDIAELSSLMIGSVKFETLYQLGKVQCDLHDVATLAAFFESPSPQCITEF